MYAANGIIPSIDAMKIFLIQGIVVHIKHNSFQVRTLSCLRDTLLPKLMPGEVRVRV